MLSLSRMSRLSISARRKAGFTLIELMVVVVILAALVGLGAIGVVNTIKGAEKTKRNAYAQTVKSAIMAYKNENGTFPLPASGTVRIGTVDDNNKPEESNAEVIMMLYGRNSNGKRDDATRAYLTDSSMLYVCKGGRRVMKLDEALAGGGISPNDMIGFVITMEKAARMNKKRPSQTRAFAPIQIAYDLELDDCTVAIPNEKSFYDVIKLN